MSTKVTPLKRSAVEAGLDNDDSVIDIDSKVSVPKVSKARACECEQVMFIKAKALTSYHSRRRVQTT